MKNVNKALIDNYSNSLKENLVLEASIKKLEKEILKQMWNIEIGTIIKDPKGNIYKISSIDRSYIQSIISDVQSQRSDLIEKPWVMGFKQRKDGTYAKNTSNLYKNWEVVT